MKITLNVDDDLLARVMRANGTTNKTKAIDLALREVDRKFKLIALASEGLGLNAAELKESLDPAYDLPKSRAVEKPVNYGRKAHSR